MLHVFFFIFFVCSSSSPSYDNDNNNKNAVTLLTETEWFLALFWKDALKWFIAITSP